MDVQCSARGKWVVGKVVEKVVRKAVQKEVPGASGRVEMPEVTPEV